MIRNYIKTALRNIRRHKGYSFINVTGLASFTAEQRNKEIAIRSG